METAAQRIARIEASLVEVRGAISAILSTGQSLGQDGRQLTHASLKELRDYERQLDADLIQANQSALSKGRSRIVSVVPL
jgi:hypothetical protein